MIRRRALGVLAAGLASAAFAAGAAAAPAKPAKSAAWLTAQGDMALGDPKAKVEVVEYASLTCGHCAAFNAEVFPAFKAKYVDTGKVRYVLKEFLTAPAEVAAAGFLTARCAGPAKYFEVVDAMFRSQADWETKGVRASLMAAGAKGGLSEDKVIACAQDDAALAALDARMERARAEGVRATPTFKVNGVLAKEGVITLAELEKAIAEAAKATSKPNPK